MNPNTTSGSTERRPRRERPLVADLMTRHVYTCTVGDTLEHAARLLWEHDCGALPVLDKRGSPVGIVTDRDICMAAHLQGKALAQIPVTAAGCFDLQVVRADASLAEAQSIMVHHRVRRLPVVDNGENLVGILSLADIVRHARPSLTPDNALHVDQVAATLDAIFRPSSAPQRRAPRRFTTRPEGAAR